jgi:signal transduction histidine kinase/ligand-binding sensor domain-containing protein
LKAASHTWHVARIALFVARLALSALLLCCGLIEDAQAVDLRNVLTDYTLTSWSRKDGLTGPVWTIAQDADGFLWLGTDEGLVRFDGVRFITWDRLGGAPLPRLTVRALRVADDGSLWVGFGATGGIARIQGKAVHMYGESEGAATGAVTAMVEDRAHTLWAAAAGGLFRLAGNRWQKLGPAQGLPEVAATNAYVDTSDTLWVGTAAGLYWRPETTEERFEQIDPASDPVRALSLSEDSTGRIWTSDPLVGFRTLGYRTRPENGVEAGRGYRLLHDRVGSLWVGTIGQGLWRVRHSADPVRATIEKTTVLSGLSSDAVRSIFEDRDGNIWAGTTEGVDRLVPHRITPWTGLGLVGTIAAAPDNRMWVGTADGLIRFSRAAGAWQPDQTRVSIPGLRALRADAKGVMWAASSDGLLRLDGTSVTRVPLPAAATPANIEAIAGDRQSGAWVVMAGGDIVRVDGGRLTLFDHVAPLKDLRVTSAMADHAGQLWLALTGSQVGVVSGRGQFTIYGPQDGVGPGPHYEMYEDLDHVVWLCGADGLSRVTDGRFATISRANGLPAGGVFAVTEDDKRNLWLATSAGIIRLARSEFEAAVTNPEHQLHLRTYDTSDGLAGFPVVIGDRNAIRASDGTLWFITSRGLSVVEPRALAAVRAAPRVTIDEVQADDRVVAGSSLPAGTSKLQVDYTAPELTYPLKTRFRYRLDGFDSDWVDAGNRRQALYTNLPPRRYAFRVGVSGDEGRWSDTEATWAFVIAPRFYQTWWFYGLCVLAAAGGVWGAWALRVRQLRRQFSLVLGERVRLSRELHDTLLQSLVGVALEFDAVSKSLDSSPAAAKERVVRIRERVEEYIREARRSIWSLRSPALETGDLIDALREGAERATSEQPVTLEFNVSGTPQRYGSDVEHQLMRIGQEAVLNAARHAHASTIRMHVNFAGDAVALRVADDGRGFDADRTAEGTTDHYGITTMRERAEQVGGHVTITSRPGEGTVVEAVVPVANAPVEGASA